MQWKVSKPSPECAACNRPLEEGDVHSALRDNGIDFDRLDFCPSCWEAQRTEGFHSYWKTRLVRDEKARKKVQYVGPDVLLDIFRKLVAGGEGKEVFTFLLGMVLVQKRVLKYVRAGRKEGREVVHLRHTRTGDDYEILHPDVTEEEMEKARQSFHEILKTEDE
jgi:hypothetical protein